MAEELYQNLVKRVDASVPLMHLCRFPQWNAEFIDPELEANMELLLEAVVLGRAARAAANIKNRQPLSRLLLRSERKLPEQFNELIEDELNVKAVDLFKRFLRLHPFLSSRSCAPSGAEIRQRCWDA